MLGRNSEEPPPVAEGGAPFSTKRKILIPLFYDYYIFEYFLLLVQRLVADGFDVTVVTFDERIRKKFSAMTRDISIIKGPVLIRWLMNRSGISILRILLWTCGWMWVQGLRRKFDFAIVPWDYRVLWYIVCRRLPALTVHCSTDFLDIELKLKRFYLPKERAQKVSHRFLGICDRIMCGKLLPKANGQVLKYKKTWLIDRLMGNRSSNGQQGFSGIHYLTVTGKEVKTNYQKLGIGVPSSPTKVVVIGNPNYEKLMELPARFGVDERKALLVSLGIPPGYKIFTLFLSPSHFTETQILEISEVVETIASVAPEAWFVLKFHPKTLTGDPEKILAALGVLRCKTTIVQQFGGDEWNARMTLASYCLVQKQSTVGYLAMLFRIPVLSYNLRATDYDDDMYRIIGGSFHAESKAEMVVSLARLQDSAERGRLVAMQEQACQKYCCMDVSPCGQISSLIQSHFLLA